MTDGTETVPTGKQPGRAVPVYPLLFAFSPVLALYITNRQEVPVSHLMRPALILLAGTALTP